jgi:hypothetical protein
MHRACMRLFTMVSNHFLVPDNALYELALIYDHNLYTRGT